jgi:cell division protein FtsB
MFTVNRIPLYLISLLFIVSFGVSTHAQQSQPQSASDASKPNSADQQTQTCPEAEALKRNIQQLSAEVQRLKTKVAQLEKDRLATTLQEQLEREQDRAEKFQLHLIEISEKEAPLQARLDQVNLLLRPEAIDRTLAGVGSVHPEDVRDEAKKSLSNEKIRIQAQLDLFRQDRYRTQASLATTDQAIQRIKQKLLEALR